MSTLDVLRREAWTLKEGELLERWAQRSLHSIPSTILEMDYLLGLRVQGVVPGPGGIKGVQFIRRQGLLRMCPLVIVTPAEGKTWATQIPLVSHISPFPGELIRVTIFQDGIKVSRIWEGRGGLGFSRKFVAVDPSGRPVEPSRREEDLRGCPDGPFPFNWFDRNLQEGDVVQEHGVVVKNVPFPASLEERRC